MNSISIREFSRMHKTLAWLIGLTALAVTFCRCGSAPTPDHLFHRTQVSDPRTFSGVEAELIPYFAEFEETCNVHVVDVPGQLAELDTLHTMNIGLCQEWSDSDLHIWHQVQFDRTFWNSADDGTRKWLVFHELGHCVLELPHFDTGIMQPAVPADAAKQLTENGPALFNQLCHKYH